MANPIFIYSTYPQIDGMKCVSVNSYQQLLIIVTSPSTKSQPTHIGMISTEEDIERY
jgi:hypothetical protein